MITDAKELLTLLLISEDNIVAVYEPTNREYVAVKATYDSYRDVDDGMMMLEGTTKGRNVVCVFSEGNMQWELVKYL